ncbi:hypothetical protein ACHAXR_000621, partial [Thalassiosira sp. AJA248-18]
MVTSQFLILPVLFQGRPWPSHAFISSLPSRTTTDRSTRTSITAPHQLPPPLVALHASKSAASKNKKKSKKKSSGGGFGSPKPSTAPRKKDAGIVYPELEPKVLQTLVPSPDDGSGSEELGSILPEEMYDRLEEIYGLEKFNFGGEGAIYKSIGVADAASDDNEEKEDDESGSLFDDILSGGGPSQGNDALDDLFAPSPSISSSSNDVDTKSSPAPSFDLNSIPPFQKFRVLHTDPMVVAIDDFFTTEE